MSKHQHDDEIDCTIAIEQLYAYLDGELESLNDNEKFEAHLGHCRSCFTRFNLEKKLGNRLNKIYKDEIPDTLNKRLSELIDKF